MKLKLVKIVDETSNIKSFFWEPAEKIEWIPGQYFYYTLPKLKYPDDRGETRHFTISSSSTEGDLLRLTAKFPIPMSGFKKTLLESKIGDKIDGRGPQGIFLQDIKLTDIKLLVAGGIGITPFRSVIKYNYDNRLKLPYLIYSNSDENFVFGDELKQILGNKILFHDSSQKGHLTADVIKSFISNHRISAHFFVVGPPLFVNSIEESFEKLGIDGGKIQSEKFTGY